MSSASLLAPQRLVIASRESRLAMWQATHIRDALQKLYPGCELPILGMTTRGDQILDQPLSQIGGKGLFIKELEWAMREGRADLAVHSLKDVPMEMPQGFCLAAVLRRENPCDAFVSNQYACLDDLPAGAVLGTSSVRREALLRARYPHVRVEALRGNLDTRLRKLDAGHYDAIILAAAGLIRLGLAERIRGVLKPEESLPAPGQGALAIEVCCDRADLLAWLTPLNDLDTARCVCAERALSRALGGSCRIPLAAYAVIEAGVLRLRACVSTPDGQNQIKAELQGALDAGEQLGLALAERLRVQGVDAILAASAAA